MNRVIRLACVAIFLCLSIPSSFSAVLEGVRSHFLNDKVQIVLDVSSPVSFQQFSLSSPPRIVLDLPKTTRRVAGRSGTQINRGAVKGVRTGYLKNGMLRVVIDLRYAPMANIYTLPAQGRRGNRIVIDVYDQRASPALTLESLNGDQSPYVIFAQGPLPNKWQGMPRQLGQEIFSSPQYSAQNGKNRITVETQVSSKGVVKSRVPVRDTTTGRSKAITTVVIDPGHGGKDAGAHNPVTGLKEKNVVLKIAKKLKQKIDAKPGFKAILTRSTDKYLKLRERTNIARKNNADLFVSIHADSVESSKPRGASVYILSTKGASSQLAKYLAKKENAVDLRWGDKVDKYDHEVQQALINMQQEATLESSNILAKKTLGTLSKIGRMHKHSVEKANFVVLQSPEIPSMLVETAFISNLQDARLLATPSYQDVIANGIADGIEQYFNEHLPQHALLGATK